MSWEAKVETCKERVANRARAAEQGERLRVWINGLPVLGAPVAVGLAWLHPLLGAVGVASLTLAWLVAIYRTELLCQVTSGRLQDAEQDLSHAKAMVDTDSDAPAAKQKDKESATWPSLAARARHERQVHTPVRHH